MDPRVEILIMKIMQSKTFDLESSEIEMIHYFMENKGILTLKVEKIM